MSNNILEKLQELVKNTVDIDVTNFTLETKFDDLGIDSIDKANILFEIENEFNFEFTDEEMFKIKTVNELVTLIEKKTTK